ncbi:potassium transporter [Parastagonospora nodorum]|nr:potassium transporter [Parastagonospora nodorum]KAH4665468.1 potassium transporter [Parastagonospora nodorum]KAH4694588.1 potassium transporter [Parastagonospora nodorum]KAH4760330.1 potassium transporter [Parastagonospora nodorum]KAH4770705.1 potassium transporter [Parastagonospora nodorum]
MVFGPWISTLAWCRARLPKRGQKIKWWRPSVNFITLHYAYIIFQTLLGSVIMYGSGNSGLRYIDALFFASGSATQSGLNTVDVNLLPLYVQVWMLISTCMCTPIFINTFVVFIRLYWFEKRFQNVVIESRNARHTRTMSRRRSEMKSEEIQRDLGSEERGVGDRHIRVMRSTNGEAEGGKIEDEHAFSGGLGNAGIRKAKPSDDEEVDPLERPMTPVHQVASNVVWADDLTTPRQRERQRLRDSVESPTERLPEKNREQSIAFVEKQREPKQKATLRIPGPRDYELGLQPEEVKEDDEKLDKVTSRQSQESHPKRNRSNSVPPEMMNGDDHPMKYHITIDVPSRQRPTTGASVYNRGRTNTNDDTEGHHTSGLRPRSRSRTFASFLTSTKEEDEDPMPYLSWTPTLGRNSNFVDLTEEQREELGGIEYRALKMLAMILTVYFVGFHLLGMVCLTPWITHSTEYKNILDRNNINHVWWGIFTPASMFNDLGFTLTPDSMVSFQRAILPLTLGTFLIIIGNTGFPCMLRFIIWLCSICVPRFSAKWEELKFLLDHPRRCFTLLFPSKANWWLFWVLIGLNGIDLIFFIILDLNDTTVTSLPPGFRFLAGLFQAAATRTAGFAVVNIAELHPAIQVSYLVMMYISIFPIAMSMRQTNVYEEKSLGVWADTDDSDEQNSYLGHHLRRQLSFDLWFVFLGFFLIAIIEGARLENTNEYAFSLFSVLFEIVSAYGTVGLSLGFPNTNPSFSGQFRTLSKLIIIAMQIRGRHRGLPYALDRAILLPSESLHQKENEDATRRARRSSNALDVGMSTSMSVDRGGAGLTRQGTGLSRISTASGDAGRPSAGDRFKPKQLKRILSGAFSAGPSTRFHSEEKRA